MRKLLITLIPIFILASCKPILKLVFNVRNVKNLDTRVEADSLNKKIIDKFDVNYILLYRTNKYVEETGDSSIWSGEVSYFDSSHILYVQHTNYCPSSTHRDINVDSLVPITRIVEDKGTIMIDRDLVGLEYLFSKPFLLESIKLKKYNVVMDFNSFWRGPEKKKLRAISKALPKDSTLFIFINKDYIKEDSLHMYEKYMSKD
jgi:hypothetical protein